jgi:hypothetical protein
MSPLKKQLFDLEVKGQTKVIMVRDTPSYGHTPTYQISLTYLERQTSYGPDKLRWEEAEAAEEEKIRLKQYVSLRSKGRNNYGLLRRWTSRIVNLWGLFSLSPKETNPHKLPNWMSTD